MGQHIHDYRIGSRWYHSILACSSPDIDSSCDYKYDLAFSSRQLFLTQSKNWPTLILSGVFATAAPFIALSWGQQYVTSAFAGISMASVALLILPLSYFFVVSEKITIFTVLGMFFGFFGVVILLGPEVFFASNETKEAFGRLACLFATFCYATSAVLTKRLPAIDPIGTGGSFFDLRCNVCHTICMVDRGKSTIRIQANTNLLAYFGSFTDSGSNFFKDYNNSNCRSCFYDPYKFSGPTLVCIF